MGNKNNIINKQKTEKTKYLTSKPFKRDHYVRKNYTYVNLGLTTIGVSALFYILFRKHYVSYQETIFVSI